MDYEKIIALINSGDEGRAELDKFVAVRPLKKAGSYIPRLDDEPSVGVAPQEPKDYVVADVPQALPMVIAPHEQAAFQPDPLPIQTMQGRVQHAIDRLEQSNPNDPQVSHLARDLGNEIARYRLTDSDQLWRTVEQVLPNAEISTVAEVARQRNQEIVQLTSDALTELHERRQLPATYKREIARLFEEERDDIRTVVAPNLDAQAAREVRQTISPFYLEDSTVKDTYTIHKLGAEDPAKDV